MPGEGVRSQAAKSRVEAAVTTSLWTTGKRSSIRSVDAEWKEGQKFFKGLSGLNIWLIGLTYPASIILDSRRVLF